MFGPTVSPQLVQSGKGRIASDPALHNLPRPANGRGPFFVRGFNEQIFGAEEQPLRWLRRLSKKSIWTRELRKSFKEVFGSTRNAERTGPNTATLDPLC